MSIIIIIIYLLGFLGIEFKWINYLVMFIIVYSLFYLIMSKPNYQKRILTIIITSSIFAIAHFPNLNTNWIGKIIAFLYFLSWGFLLSYITWRYNLLVSIFIHFAFNSSYLLLTKDADIITKDAYIIEINNPLGVNDKPLARNSTGDTITFQGNMISFFYQYQNIMFNDTNSILINRMDLKNIKVNIYIKDVANTDYKTLFNDILKHQHLKLDTNLLPTYDFVLNKGIKKIVLGRATNPLGTLLQFKSNCISNFGIPFKINNEDTTIPMYYDHSVFYKLSREEKLQFIKDSGYELSIDSTDKLKLLSINEIGNDEK